MKKYSIGFREVLPFLSITIFIAGIFAHYTLEMFTVQRDTIQNDDTNKMEYSPVIGESQYHPSEETIRKNTNYKDNVFYVKGKNGNTVPVQFAKTQSYPVYYTPGSFPYGASNYVPTYEDAVKLSKIDIPRKYH